jgi:CRP-like cAMP-binding protein
MPSGAQNHFLTMLDEADRAAITPLLHPRDFTAGQILYEPGTEVDTVYFPAGCCLSVIKMMADGRAVETRTIGAESAFGLLHAVGSRHSLTRVLVQLPGQAHSVSANQLARLADHSASLRRSLIAHAQISSAQAEQSVACNVLHSVEQRLARWLLMSLDRTDQDPLNLTHEFLALMLGVQRTSVTVAARRMQDEGIIKYSRGRVSVLSRPALLRIVCECYGAYQRDQARLLEPPTTPRVVA